MTNTTKKTRGERYAGGIYVGTTAAGVAWVARATRTQTEAEAFAFLCKRFDKLEARHGRKLVRVPQSVVEVAEDIVEAARESGRGYEYRAKVTATTVAGRPALFADIAAELRCLADQREAGEMGMAQRATCEVDWRFAEATDKRFAKAMRKWAAKCERAAS